MKSSAWAFQVDDNGQLLIAFLIKRLSSSVSAVFARHLIGSRAELGRVALGIAPANSQPWRVNLMFALAVAGSGVETVASVLWTDDRNVDEALYSQALALDSIPPTAAARSGHAGRDRSNLLTSTRPAMQRGFRATAFIAATRRQALTPKSPRAWSPQPAIVMSSWWRPLLYQVAAVDGTANTGPLTAAVSATAVNNSNLPTTGTIAYAANNEIRLATLPTSA